MRFEWVEADAGTRWFLNLNGEMAGFVWREFDEWYLCSYMNEYCDDGPGSFEFVKENLELTVKNQANKALEIVEKFGLNSEA